jgi:signal transduction histidine kinase
MTVPSEIRQMTSLLSVAGIEVWTVDAGAAHEIISALQIDAETVRDHLRRTPETVDKLLGAVVVRRADNEAVSASTGQHVWPEESRYAFIDIITGVLMKASKVDVSCRLLRQGGERFEGRMTACRAESETDDIRILIAVRDVSAEHKAFADLKDSELRYKHVFDNLPIALAEIDSSGLSMMFRDLRGQGVTDLSAYLDNHPEFINEALRAMRVERVSKTLARLMGARSPKEMLGDLVRYWDVGLPVLRQSLEARFRGEEFFEAETKLRRLDGGVVDVLFSTARHGHLQDRAVCSFVDFTERNKADQDLRKSERRYQDLFQAMTVSFWELDLSVISKLLDENGLATDEDIATYLRGYPDCVEMILTSTKIVDVNDQTLTLFGGLNKSDLLGSLDRFWSPERWVDGASAVLNVLVDSASMTIETRLRRLDGVEFDAQFTLWFSADDRNRGLAAVTDITERVRAYQRLEESEQRFRDLFQHLPVPVLQVNSARLLRCLEKLKAEGVDDLAVYLSENPGFVQTAMDNTLIEHANDAAMKVLGAPNRTILVGPITPLFRNHVDIYARLLHNRFQDFETYEEEIALTTFDGRVREGNLTVTFMPSMKTRGVTINAFVDTTEKKEAERRLRQVEAEYAHAARISMLGELTASIAHEVNQPLAAITTYGEAGLRWLNGPDAELAQFKDIMGRIVADARRAAGIIGRVRSMASRRRQEHDLLVLDELVAEALQFLKYELQFHNVKVTHHRSGLKSPVHVDRIQVQQVIVNLVVNAVQAMSGTTRREILVQTAVNRSQVHCSVEDSGPGIPGDKAASIFESFFTTKEGGMGMGLPISRSIIEAHDGTMNADNDSALGGARFSFSLPLSGAEKH